MDRFGNFLPAMAHVDDDGTTAGIQVSVTAVVFEPDTFGFDRDR
jgi:hypothetical protein